jgi:transcriptional regulator with XRE-family HTH domain
MTGAELRQKRKALSYSMRALGAIIGRHPESVSRWEQSKVPVPGFMSVLLAGLKPAKKRKRRAKRRRRR